jgi:predicted metal-dependent enzyme (double-stranded beta helix superfamily)
MYTLDNLLDELRQAVAVNDLTAVADVVQKAVREKPSVAQAEATQSLHTEPGLTVLHTVVNPGFASPPHDHRTWAVIGVYNGQEDNTFYRLIDSSRRIEQVGGRSVRPGEVLTLGIDAIHKIANPGSTKLIALHVYGKNVLEIERSAWDLATGNERPFKLPLDARGRIRQ